MIFLDNHILHFLLLYIFGNYTFTMLLLLLLIECFSVQISIIHDNISFLTHTPLDYNYIDYCCI